MSKKKKEAYESYVYRKAGMVECTAWMGVSLPMHFKRYDKQAKPKKKIQNQSDESKELTETTDITG